MAASIRIIRSLCCKSTLISQPFRHYQSYLQRAPVRTGPSLSARQSQCFCKAASLHDEAASQTSEAQTRYKDRPWDYLESEEYAEKYGSSPVWASYRRNHKGGIPPQKTRKTCIRGDQICGNPCPICRDPNIIIHHQNVKLLQQFISPHTGMVYDPIRTGVCMKQQKNLDKAVVMARDHGLLPFQIPHVEFSGEDYSNSHHAVGSTPPPPCLLSGSIWYSWYGEITPDSRDVAKVKKTYKAYLK
ncbi:28S ribosomal protein S18b, mitochondrial [Melanotaenia boesemani]|uniref:28S ribosomal protein S18b, mitochondrial n=1 Tax=Melanotaenia boesemani TaxID=1250792 RepID=UPI001C056BFB|nr:28S ribosomal protein S18b, mitochondrial [Melanotaenia boesemani]